MLISNKQKKKITTHDSPSRFFASIVKRTTVPNQLVIILLFGLSKSRMKE